MLDTSTYHHRIKNCNNTLYSLFKLIASKATVNDYIVSSFNSLTTFVGLHGIRHRLITIFRSFHTHFHASGDDLNAGGYHLNASGDFLKAGGYHLNASGVLLQLSVTHFKSAITHFYAIGTFFQQIMQYLQMKNTFFQHKKYPNFSIITHLKSFGYHLKLSGTFPGRQSVFLHFFRHFIQVKFSFVEPRMT